ncbi:DUF2304 family protein [Patulibacter americanus]|uniref:DUF2304 family protein n=1 Tax=Patulibacter americanus TaxID=588672 RepID=UPI0003B3BB54|nr:DUF2304 family protein [Patulibacter americanus]
MSAQAVLIALGGALLLASTVVLVRRQLLTIRYGLGWSVAALFAIVGAPVLDALADHVVRDFGFTPTGFSLGVFISCLAAICVQLSISVSGMQRVAQDLGEYSALLEQRVRALEAQRAPTALNADAERTP